VGAIVSAEDFVLQDGSRIAVIGGGPAGSFFSIFALKMARMLGKELEITIYEPKDFTKDGPGGCNRCGGVISELLVQTLALEGINLPDSVVQRGINAYQLYTNYGTASIATPAHEKTIATVYRGGGPKGTIGSDKDSFDKFLLDMAVEEGAVHEKIKVDRVEYKNGKPVLYSKDGELINADLLVGAFGINSTTPKIIEDLGIGYKRPDTAVTAMAELKYDSTVIAKHFGNAIHLFLLPIRDIKFAAIIPKGTYITVCILGKTIDANIVNDFLENRVVKNALPQDVDYELMCRCLPKMNIRAPASGYADRVVMCGDAGSTRLFKDGLGAAYIMGKAAAKAAVLHGVSSTHFREHYLPVYKNIITDNLYGSCLYVVSDMYRNYPLLTKGMLAIVNDEQKKVDNPKKLSTVLWGMFTGNERYRNMFNVAMTVPLQAAFWREHAKILVGRG